MEAVKRKKVAHKMMCWNGTEENKRRCKNVVSEAMREKVKILTEKLAQ